MAELFELVHALAGFFKQFFRVVDVAQLLPEFFLDLQEFGNGRHMEFLLKGIDGIEALIELVKSGWVEFYMVSITTDFLGNIFKFDVAVVESFGQFLGIGVHLLDSMQSVGSSFHLFHGSPLFACKQAVGFEKRLLDFF